MTTVVDERGVVRRLTFVGDEEPELVGRSSPARTRHVAREVRRYLSGRSTRPDLRVDLEGTAFQLEVWRALRKVPRGRAISFGRLAALIGRPGAVRACTRAVVTAPVELIVPVHRVVGADGRPSGPVEVAARKRRLLTLEGAWDESSGRVPAKRRWPRAKAG